MIHREVRYISREAEESKIASAILKILAAYLEGERIIYAGAGKTGANVQTESGRYLFMAAKDGSGSLREAIEGAVMTEVVDKKQVQLARETWERLFCPENG